MRHRRSFLFAIGSAGLLWTAVSFAGQLSATLSGPSLGYVCCSWDGKLHPLQGILGNATIGDPIDIGFSISTAVALDGRHFLATRDSGESLLAINMEKSPPLLTAIPDAPPNPSIAAGSRHGSAAGLYYGDQQKILIIVGLPSNPRVAYSIDAGSLGDPLSRLAVSDDGNLLVYAAPQQERTSVLAWTPASGSRVIATADAISDITFSGNGDVLLADDKANEVFSIHDPGGSAGRYFLADGRSGVSGPRGVTVSNGNLIYVANAGSKSILTLDSNGRVLRTKQCNCELSGLFPLKDSIYRLSNWANRTIYLLETGSSGDRVVFVPMLHETK